MDGSSSFFCFITFNLFFGTPIYLYLASNCLAFRDIFFFSKFALFHPGSSPLSLLVFSSHFCRGSKNDSKESTDISLVPVSFSNASVQGKLEPSFSIFANERPASFDPEISHRCNGTSGSAMLHNPSKNWNWKIVLVKYL